MQVDGMDMRDPLCSKRRELETGGGSTGIA